MGLRIVEHKALPAELRSTPLSAPPAAIIVSDPTQLVKTVRRKINLFERLEYLERVQLAGAAGAIADGVILEQIRIEVSKYALDVDDHLDQSDGQTVCAPITK